MRAYNVFRSQGSDGLCCAVPEERSVPNFVSNPSWTFEGKVDNCRYLPFGFDRKAADAGVRFNGFYLFASFRDENHPPETVERLLAAKEAKI